MMDGGRKPAPVSHSPQMLARVSHEIIDAVSAVVVNLEFLAQGADGAKQPAVDDARRSLDRIVKLAEGLRRTSKQL